MSLNLEKLKVGIISGYFNPLHCGHIDYMMAAKDLCHVLIAIVNNDYQANLKGSFGFQDEKSRKKIVDSISYVDFSKISIDKDDSVRDTLELMYKEVLNSENIDIYFINSGDREEKAWNKREKEFCEEKSIKCIYLNLPKVNSSSSLVGKAMEYGKFKSYLDLDGYRIKK